MPLLLPLLGCVGLLVHQELYQPKLKPPLELCTQRRPLLPVPAEELTRSIRWSVDWQRAGRVILSQQLMDRVIRAETRVG